MLSFTQCSVDLWSGHQHSLLHPLVQQLIVPGGSVVNSRVDILLSLFFFSINKWLLSHLWCLNIIFIFLQFAILYLLITLSHSKAILFLLSKEILGPKFEWQNEKLLLITLTYYFPSCLRFFAFAIAKTFQNTLVKWSWKSFMHILWKKLQIYLQFWIIKYVFSWTIKIFCPI